MAELKIDEFVKSVGQKVAEDIKQNYIERAVLEQIRAEIEQIQGNEYEVSDMQGNRYKYETIEKAEALQIIDKYKGE